MLDRAIAEIEGVQEDWARPSPLADMQAEDASAIAKVSTLRSCFLGGFFHILFLGENFLL